LDLIIQILMPM